MLRIKVVPEYDYLYDYIVLLPSIMESVQNEMMAKLLLEQSSDFPFMNQ